MLFIKQVNYHTVKESVNMGLYCGLNSIIIDNVITICFYLYR